MQIKQLQWVDTHCHLEMLKEDPDQALERGKTQGLGHAVTIGTNHKTNQDVIGFCERFDAVSGALGIHPHHAGEATKEHINFIDQHLSTRPKIVAVGECGLDFFYSFSDSSDQKRVFINQLELAIKHQLPVVIHSRQAEQETLDCLSQVDVTKLRGVFHSFTSSIEMAKAVLDLGFYLSFNGICTFKKSDSVREVLKLVPKDKLLLETDSPYLSPVPHRGKPNTPGNVAVIGQYVADFLQIDLSLFALQCFQNSQQLFGFNHES